jgi:hypothetical protein
VRRLALLAILLGLTLTAAACGSASTDYRGKVAGVQQKYERQLTDLTTQVTTSIGTDPAAASLALTKLAAAVNGFANEVADVEAPADQRAVADQLVGAYRTLAKGSLDLKAALETKDQAALTRALEEFGAATAGESAAVDAFNAAV